MIDRLRSTALLTLACAAAGALLFAAPALASAPRWEIHSTANTQVEPGGTLRYLVVVGDPRSEPTVGSTTLTATLPPALKAQGYDVGNSGYSCATAAHSFTCERSFGYERGSRDAIEFVVSAEPDAEAGVQTARFEVSGGGIPSASTVDPVTVSESPAVFGISGFDAHAADADGETDSRAGGHPYSFTTSLEFNTHTDPSPVKGERWPVEATRDITVELPPGFVGNLAGYPHCTLAELLNTNDTGELGEPECSPDSQIGTVLVKHSGAANGVVQNLIGGEQSVYNMVPPPGVAARIAFDQAALVIIDVTVQSGGDYGVVTRVKNVSEAVPVAGSELTLWGVPADPGHQPDRACPGREIRPSEGGPTCASTVPPQAIFRNPTSCTAPGVGLPSSLAIDSWENPGAWVEKTIFNHETPGYPYADQEWGAQAAIEGCEEVPFEPSFSAEPTTNRADSPSGLSVDLSMPQGCWEAKASVAEAEESICQSDLRDVEMTLPPGVRVNPSSAGGLGACSEAQIGYKAGTAEPFEFTPDPVSCPDSSKIGKVTIDTPLLNEPLTGAVYLARQRENPFGSLLAMYLVAEGSGVVVKQAGEIVADPQNGSLKTVFSDAPQTPFADLRVELFGGQRAPLRTPSSCGDYTTSAKLTPWSGNGAVERQSQFQITQCSGSGFAPQLSAGTENPLAGSYSPFTLRLTRADGMQELAGLSVTLPKGLLGKLAGIPYCPDSALASVSTEEGTGTIVEGNPPCPPGSQVGTVTVGAGAGANPFYTKAGRAYLAGPYKGAPLSLAVVAPAVAGPFDLGSVVVRNALRVNPETAEITAASDPLPTILHGIPLDLRDVRVEMNRPEFTLNPTSCEPLSVTSTVTSTLGATANPSQHFQAANCQALAFKPGLSLRLAGKRTRAGFPSLTATVRMPSGGANIARTMVALPHSEFLAQSHLGDVCTRVVYAEGAGGGERCPASSIYGHAVAYSPLLEKPLEGNVYLRSNGGERELPDLVVSLSGQIHIDLVGYVGANKKTDGIQTTFAGVPDAPVSKFVLTMPAGKHSLLENHINICRGKHRAIVQMDGQNGKIHDFRPLLKVAGCPGKTKQRRGRR